jgi:hypothetical protein
LRFSISLPIIRCLPRGSASSPWESLATLFDDQDDIEHIFCQKTDALVVCGRDFEEWVALNLFSSAPPFDSAWEEGKIYDDIASEGSDEEYGTNLDGDTDEDLDDLLNEALDTHLTDFELTRKIGKYHRLQVNASVLDPREHFLWGIADCLARAESQWSWTTYKLRHCMKDHLTPTSRDSRSTQTPDQTASNIKLNAELIERFSGLIGRLSSLLDGTIRLGQVFEESRRTQNFTARDDDQLQTSFTSKVEAISKHFSNLGYYRHILDELRADCRQRAEDVRSRSSPRGCPLLTPVAWSSLKAEAHPIYQHTATYIRKQPERG